MGWYISLCSHPENQPTTVASADVLPDVLLYGNTQHVHHYALMAHLTFHCIARPQTWFNQRTARHRPESMATDFLGCVISHNPQGLIYGIFTDWFTRIMCSRKDQTIFNSPCLKFCQYGYSLFAEWHKVWCSNLGSPMRVQAVWANKKENINKTIRPLGLDGYCAQKTPS